MKAGERLTTVSYCSACHRETPHELRPCDGAFVNICAGCLERAVHNMQIEHVKSAAQ